LVAPAVSHWHRSNFGGPQSRDFKRYDNLHRLHRLIFIQVRPHKLLVELDHQLWLILTDVSNVYADNSELILEDFAQGVFDWQAYSSLSPRVEVFKSGVIRLLPPVGT
jgi:hypothetical protein